MKRALFAALLGAALCTPFVHANMTPDAIRNEYMDLMELFANDVLEANPHAQEISLSWEQLGRKGAQKLYTLVMQSVNPNEDIPNLYLYTINRLNGFLSHTRHARPARLFTKVFSLYRSHMITRRKALWAFERFAPYLGVERRNR